MVIADFNKDGFPDMLTSFADKSEQTIYWGSTGGFTNGNISSFRADSETGGKAADLNNDGYLDVVIPSTWKDKAKEDYSSKSFIFWGSPEGFDVNKSQRVSVSGSSRCVIQDFNRDGLLDIAFTSYYSNDTRSDLYVPIFWGGPEGFDLSHSTWLPTIGTNAITNDTIDIGNVYTRRLEEFYISSPFNVGDNCNVTQISWDAETPPGTSIKFQLRTAPAIAQLAANPWQGWFGPDSYYEISGSPVQNTGHWKSWIQYRAIFTSRDRGSSAVLKQVRIGYCKY